MNTYQELQLDALGEPMRRAIVDQLLKKGPSAVGELARQFPVSRPAISQHLAVLKSARLVTDRRDGNRRLYQIDPAGFDSLRSYFDQFWSDALAAFKRHADQQSNRRRKR
ncbi:MAG TPA: metalloregulator ArsR/SmtB family transcription factor [Longimicrobiales bacterium]|nr:metalloregulator ArsR/SmtB family transcription factor [Longimicrobiales bacterium]